MPKMLGALTLLSVARYANRRGGRRGSMSTWEHHEAQHAVYIGPWMLMLAAGAAGQIVHALYAAGGPWQPFVPWGVVFATIALSYVGWVNTHERSPIALGHVLVTIVLGGAWMVLAARTGLLAWELHNIIGRLSIPLPTPQRPTVDLYLLLGFILATMWNMRQGVRVSEHRKLTMEEQIGNDWTEAGFAGVKGKVKRENKYRSSGIGTMPKGMYLEQLQKGARAIESAHGWPSDSLTLLPYSKGTSARRFRMVVMHADPLDGPVEWPGVET